MGTSISSSGPGGNVPFDPPWLNEDDIPDNTNQPQEKDDQPNEDENKSQEEDDQSHGNESQLNHQTEVSLPTNFAPQRRFSSANKNFKQFMCNGSQESFGRALGGYAGKGMGGSSRIVRRMQRSTNI